MRPLYRMRPYCVADYLAPTAAIYPTREIPLALSHDTGPQTPEAKATETGSRGFPADTNATSAIAANIDGSSKAAPPTTSANQIATVQAALLLA